MICGVEPVGKVQIRGYARIFFAIDQYVTNWKFCEKGFFCSLVSAQRGIAGFVEKPRMEKWCPERETNWSSQNWSLNDDAATTSGHRATDRPGTDGGRARQRAA